MFKEWVGTDDHKLWCTNHADNEYECEIVIKIDCVGHVSKNFSSKVEKVAKSGKTLKDGKSINKGKHRLGKIACVKLQKNFRNAVKRSVMKVHNKRQMEEGTAEMKKNIMAVLYHSSDLPPEIRHQYCPKESWCLFNTSSPEKLEHQDHHLDKAVHEELISIFEAYSTDAILQKMLPGYTTNRNEAFNHVMWTVLPKSKFHGLEIQRLACRIALLVFQDGNSIIPES